MWRDGTRRGRASQALQPSVPSVMDGTAADSLVVDRYVCRNRMARTASRSSSHGAACGFWSRASGPTRAHRSRNRPLERLGSTARPAQGWAGHSRDRRRLKFKSHRTPAPGVNSPCLVRAGRIGNARFVSRRSLLCGETLPAAPQPSEQGPGHSAVPFGDGRPFS